ncbi:MAG: sulfatase, partial [Myxococcota bacterium]|nr:sulfatase [Myxococcota bacterium]
MSCSEAKSDASSRLHPAVLALLLGCSTSAPPGAPNVLLVSLDTLRADHLASYGYERDTSPTLSRFAAEGAQFEQAYSQTSSTDGSHASLFTGLYLSEHGKFSHRQRLGWRELTLAEHFDDHGYRTFAIATSVKFVEQSGFDQGFDDYDRIQGVTKNKRSAAALELLDERMAQDEEPWMGFLHLFDVHAPYAAPEPWRSKWQPVSDLVEPEATSRFIRRNHFNEDKVTPPVQKHLEGLYDGQISYLDQYLAQLRQTLEAQSQKPGARSTLLVLTSDHGEAFMEHDFLGHGEVLYEETVRVPLLVWWPGKVPAGRRIDTPTQGVDVFPTLAELVGIPLPGDI